VAPAASSRLVGIDQTSQVCGGSAPQ
jgi:hypothetical protein